MNNKRNSRFVLADYESTTDPLAEAFRMLRLQVQTNLSPTSHEKGQIVLITSSMEKEGKTTTACNLAQMCAIAHIPTLLIDADLRRPNVHNFFGIPREPGVTDQLLADERMEIEVVETLVPNLYLLPSGKPIKYSTEVLGSQGFRTMLNKLKNRFKLIIIDTPPAGVVSDVGVLVQHVEAVFLLVHAGVTKIRTVKQVVRTIQDLRGNLKGVILSRINPRRDRYYYYHNYPHYYSSYYSDKSKS